MKRFTIWEHKFVRGGLAAVFWLAVWQTVSLCAPRLLFASPARTLAALARLLVQGDFWLSVGNSLAAIALGFVLGFVLGAALAALCHRFALPRVLLAPAVQIMKSVPVACFIVVALIWMSSAYLSVLVSLFVVFPVTYVGVTAELDALDPALTEMARVFRVPRGRRVRLIYLPQMLPGVLAGCRVSVGMCWKAGVAGELIGLPAHSIGEKLYLTKLYFSIDELFAWTLVIIAISLAFEKLLVRVLRAAQRGLEEGSHGHPV